MDDDVRYDRDIYTWLTTFGMSQHYFLFKSHGYEKIRDILYCDEDDIVRIGITDAMDLTKLMVGIRHVAVPDSMLTDPRYTPVLQCGRLLVEIFAFVDYKTLVYSTGVCKGWKNSLVTGVKTLRIEKPKEMKASVKDIMVRFKALTHLKAVQWGPHGAEGLKRGAVTLIAKTDLGAVLRDLDLSGNWLGNEGCNHVCEAMQLGGMTHLESLNLSYNQLKMKAVTNFSRALCFKRHRQLRVLDMSGNPFGDQGCVDLAAAFDAEAVPVLTELRLGSCFIGNPGAKALARSLGGKSLPQLAALDMRYNINIGDPGGKHLVLAVQRNGMPRLEFLCMKGASCGRDTCMKMMRAADGLFDAVV